MKTASRIVGTALFMSGYEVQDAPRYGAERRGAPMFAFVRAGREPIFERGIIAVPDLVLVADESLVAIPAAGVLAGLRSETVIAVAGEVGSEIWRERLHLENTFIPLPGHEVGDDDHIPDTSAQCAGAAAGLLGIVDREVLAEAVREEIAPLGENAVAANLATALAAFDDVQPWSGRVVEGEAHHLATAERTDWVDLPAETADVSAPNIYAGLTSVQVRTGLWRTLRPVLEREKCKKCTWVCGNYCPDGVIAVDEDGYPKVDYEHCKGCMVCVAQCPPHALIAVAEEETQATNGVPA